ncbi:hypothetical protein JHK82_052783 [Glycine max]|nr:hypothetical protein JHK84_052665 [Glycine max]KAG5085386.1 hypothetical protein JHK82_052783 [Glycine max]
MDDEQQLRHERDPYNKYGRSTWFLHTKRRTCCQLHSPWLTLKAINPIQDDIMVISVEITNCIVRTTLVDQGSSVDILFWNTFKRMGITEFKILPHDDPYLAVSEKGLGRKEAQGLADFVNEFHPLQPQFQHEWWTLHVDNSSNQHGSGARIILKGPNHITLG